MCFNSANRRGQNFSHFLVCHFMEMAQDQHYAIFRGQFSELFMNHGLAGVRFQLGIDLLLTGGISYDLLRLYSHLYSSISFALFKLFQSAIVGDAIEPGGKASITTE